MDFSIIIPVYNEERRIPKHIDEICRFFQTLPQRAEIVFVNDGSRDGTLSILKRYQEMYQFQIVQYEENRGKGYAIRQGAAAAKGDWIIFFDIDLATPLSEFQHWLNFQRPDNDIIIGSRRLAGSRIVKGESGIRVFLGKSFSLLSRLFVPSVTDFTCGFKTFSRRAATLIFPMARIDRWAFDTELLYIAKLRGIPIRQMPVVWAHDEQSRVRVLKDALFSAWELGKIAWNRVIGKYSKPQSLQVWKSRNTQY